MYFIPFFKKNSKERGQKWAITVVSSLKEVQEEKLVTQRNKVRKKCKNMREASKRKR